MGVWGEGRKGGKLTCAGSPFHQATPGLEIYQPMSSRALTRMHVHCEMQKHTNCPFIDEIIYDVSIEEFIQYTLSTHTYVVLSQALFFLPLSL